MRSVHEDIWYSYVLEVGLGVQCPPPPPAIVHTKFFTGNPPPPVPPPHYRVLSSLPPPPPPPEGEKAPQKTQTPLFGKQLHTCC